MKGVQLTEVPLGVDDASIPAVGEFLSSVCELPSMVPTRAESGAHNSTIPGPIRVQTGQPRQRATDNMAYRT